MDDFVVHGEWVDHAWRAAAAKPAGQRTEMERLTYAAGPRTHPWGPHAVSAEVEGRTLVFPNTETHDAWHAANTPAEAQAEAAHEAEHEAEHADHG